MTGPTHKQFAICFAFIGAMFLYTKGLFSYGFGYNTVNYYFALIIMLTIGKKGALFPDVDHDWDNVKEKTVPNKIINVLIHLTKGHHRSWQTHSLDISIIALISSYVIPLFMYKMGNMSNVNKEIVTLVCIGFTCGWVSHEFSDMMNGVGIRIFFWSKKKIAFVPKKIGKFRFNTGEEWEEFCFTVVRIVNMVLGVASIMYPITRKETFRLLLRFGENIVQFIEKIIHLIMG